MSLPTDRSTFHFTPPVQGGNETERIAIPELGVLEWNGTSRRTDPAIAPPEQVARNVALPVASRDSRPAQIAFLVTQTADGLRRLEAHVAEDVTIPAGSTLRLVLLHGHVAATVVIDPPRRPAIEATT